MEPTRPANVPADARWNPTESIWEQAKREGDAPVGPYRAFRKDGSLLFAGRLVDGRLHGAFKRFHPDGTVAREGTYENGALRGTVGVTRGPNDGFPWRDERSRRAQLAYDDDGDETSRLEFDERGREVKPGVALGERDGSLDPVFAEHGPDRFLASGAFARAIAALAPPASEPPKPDGLYLPHSALPRRRLTAERFAALYGLPMPEELAAWLEAVKGSPKLFSVATTPEIDVAAEGNLVEAAIVEYQAAPGRTTFWQGIASASLPIGRIFSLDLMLGLFEGVNQVPNAVYPFDASDYTFGSPVARSLDDFAYLVAIVAAEECGAISRSALVPAYEKLRGRVDLPGGFREFESRALPGGPGGEVEGDTKTDHREGFALRRPASMPIGHTIRARWLGALLRGHVEEAYELFLPAWDAPMDKTSGTDLADLLTAIKSRISTAVYGLFRCWIFQKPELPQVIEAGRASPSRLIADAALLVSELAAGRKALGAIEDLESVRAAFVALKPKEKKEAKDQDESDGDDESDDDE
jgi:hypothetical protein